MDDMNQMLSSILGDPESLQQIKELAEMLQSEENASGQQQTEGSGTSDGAAGMGIDLGMIAEIGKAFSAAGTQDKNSDLLLALRPHLSPERQERVDRAVKMLRLYAMITILKESGILGKLF